MSDYIKRESRTFIEIADDLNDLVTELNDKIVETIREKNALAKSAVVAPVRHGHWIEYGENKDGTHNICCSVCDGFFKSKGHANSCYTRNKYRYCPNCGVRMDNCGARMDGENDEID